MREKKNTKKVTNIKGNILSKHIQKYKREIIHIEK